MSAIVIDDPDSSGPHLPDELAIVSLLEPIVVDQNLRLLAATSPSLSSWVPMPGSERVKSSACVGMMPIS